MHIQQMKRCEKRERDRARKRECDRERKWRKETCQGAFESSFVRLDLHRIAAFEESPSWLSDGGKGAEDIIAACDACYELSHYECLKELARQRVKRIDRRLLPVLELVFKNRENRKESIWQLMKQVLRKRRNGKPPRCGIGIT